MHRVLDSESVFSRVQRPIDYMRDYVSAMKKLGRRIPTPGEDLFKRVIL